MYLNKVFLIGNLTRDVTLRSTPSGQPVADFGLATTRVWTDHLGQKQQETEFHQIIVWGKMAELCSQYLSKGRLVLVEGRIRTRTWVDQNGTKRYRTEIIAENIKFGPRKEEAETIKTPEEIMTPPEESLEIPQEETTEDLPIVDASSKEDFNQQEEGIDLEDIPF
ncbi:MAG: single-stranded DNA-binding protein [Candidatus Paceibacterota bacterium]